MVDDRSDADLSDADLSDLPEFSWRSAARADAAGRLDDWVTAFLASPGSDNEPLAAALGFAERRWAGPVLLPLDQMRKLAGPEDGTDAHDGPGAGIAGAGAEADDDTSDAVLVPIDGAEWEDDIDRMVEHLEEGWDPPPLVVSHRVDGFHLEDGNHRHETMVRAGRTHAWAVVAFDDDVERDRFLASHPTRAVQP